MKEIVTLFGGGLGKDSAGGLGRCEGKGVWEGSIRKRVEGLLESWSGIGSELVGAARGLVGVLARSWSGLFERWSLVKAWLETGRGCSSANWALSALAGAGRPPTLAKSAIGTCEVVPNGLGPV